MMKIGFLQFKPVLCKPYENVSKIREIISNCKNSYDLLVMPELANSGYLFTSIEEVNSASEEIPDGNFCRALAEISKEKNAFVVSGICERAGDKLFNSAVLISPNGEFNIYRKTHLFLDEKVWFSPGDTGLNVFEISGEFGKVKVGMMICFDWIFPESARTLALKGAQIIAHPSNLVLSYCQQAMFTRAVENRVFTITANRTGTEINGDKELYFTGKSVIVDPKGNYLCTAGENDETIMITEINPEAALDKNVTVKNNIFEDRREEFYS
jgi:predicted amidohydrolase